MRVVEVPVFQDNYAYLLIDDESKIAAAIDPAQSDKVIKAAEREGVKIQMVLTTHHHLDHAGGNEEMKASLPEIKVYGGDTRIQALTNELKHGDKLSLGKLSVSVYASPCHTSGHVLYFVEDPSSKPAVLFTGDTLFIGGCGRFFEGTPQQMYDALLGTVAKLPKDTLVYCGHEYTLKNLDFAVRIEPSNESAKQKLQWAKQQREKGAYTVPSTIEEELQYNPFMRVNVEEVAKAVNLSAQDPIAVMAELRERKNKS